MEQHRHLNCRIHAWEELSFRQAATVDGRDGYRLVRRCARCKRRAPGRFIPIESSVVPA